jgi:hypothetical protein
VGDPGRGFYESATGWKTSTWLRAIDKNALNGRAEAEGAGGGLLERSSPLTQSGVE